MHHRQPKTFSSQVSFFVRFAPKATKLLRCRKVKRWASRRHWGLRSGAINLAPAPERMPTSLFEPVIFGCVAVSDVRDLFA